MEKLTKLQKEKAFILANNGSDFVLDTWDEDEQRTYVLALFLAYNSKTSLSSLCREVADNVTLVNQSPEVTQRQVYRIELLAEFREYNINIKEEIMKKMLK